MCTSVCACKPGVLWVILCGPSVFGITCLGLLRSRGCGTRKVHVTAGPLVVTANDVTVLTILILVQIRAFCIFSRDTASLSTALWSVPQQQVFNSSETNKIFLL